jgi:TolB protein
MITFDAANGIYVVDADGSHLRLLFSSPPDGGPGYPSWSPDGNQILFLDTPRGATGFAAEVWTMKPDGSGRRSLYRSPCCGLWSPPIWSPDGKAIAVGMSAYTAGGITRNGIVVMDAQGHHQRRVLGNPEAIAWQPIPRTP